MHAPNHLFFDLSLRSSQLLFETLESRSHCSSQSQTKDESEWVHQDETNSRHPMAPQSLPCRRKCRGRGALGAGENERGLLHGAWSRSQSGSRTPGSGNLVTLEEWAGAAVAWKKGFRGLVLSDVGGMGASGWKLNSLLFCYLPWEGSLRDVERLGFSETTQGLNRAERNSLGGKIDYIGGGMGCFIHRHARTHTHLYV